MHIRSCKRMKMKISFKTVQIKLLVLSQLFPYNLMTFTNGTNHFRPKMMDLHKKFFLSSAWRQQMIIYSLKLLSFLQNLLNLIKKKEKELQKNKYQVAKRILNQTLSSNFTHFLAAKRGQKILSRRRLRLQYPAQNFNRKFSYFLITRYRL